MPWQHITAALISGFQQEELSALFSCRGNWLRQVPTLIPSAPSLHAQPAGAGMCHQLDVPKENREAKNEVLSLTGQSLQPPLDCLASAVSSAELSRLGGAAGAITATQQLPLPPLHPSFAKRGRQNNTSLENLTPSVPSAN